MTQRVCHLVRFMCLTVATAAERPSGRIIVTPEGTTEKKEKDNNNENGDMSSAVGDSMDYYIFFALDPSNHFE